MQDRVEELVDKAEKEFDMMQQLIDHMRLLIRASDVQLLRNEQHFAVVDAKRILLDDQQDSQQ